MASQARCGLTRSELFGLVDKYNAEYKDDRDNAARIFNQTFVAGTEDFPKCKRCNKCIAQHEGFPSRAASRYGGVAVKGRLEGWRTKFGLRKIVTKFARSMGAFGTISPVNFDIDVDVVFETLAHANTFVIDLRGKAPLFMLRCELQVKLLDVFPADLNPVVDYRRVPAAPGPGGDDPDRESTVTASAIVNLRKHEALNHRLVTMRTMATQVIHIVPKPVLETNVEGTWMVIAGCKELDDYCDADVPLIDLDIEVGGAVGEYTRLLLLIDATRLPQPDEAYLLRTVVDGSERRGTVVCVPIAVRTTEFPLFAAAIAWRKVAVAKAIARMSNHDEMHGNNRPPGNAWWTLEPLTNYEVLTPFAREPNSPRSQKRHRHKQVSSTTSDSDEDDEDVHDSNVELCGDRRRSST